MTRSRAAGIVCPLSSIRTRGDFGVGELGDVARFAKTMLRAGLTVLSILPPHEIARGETSPYGARTAFGLDATLLSLRQIAEVDDALVASAISDAERRALAKSTDTVDFEAVRTSKAKVLAKAFARFYADEWSKGTPRADALRAFVEREKSWAVDLALYVAVRESHADHGWDTWPDEEREREPSWLAKVTALDASNPFEKRILEHLYTQWQLFTQWDAMREELRTLGVSLVGDLPFIVGKESADVWAHRAAFRTDVTLGAPPDPFSEDGQDWGLPAYAWTKDGASEKWLAERVRQAARLYDGFRLDHVVGYFRQWVKPHGGRGRFDRTDEKDQLAHGRAVLELLLREANGATLIAEDLGVVPPFVRRTLGDLDVPGYRIVPWDKDERHVIRAPSTYPERSIAAYATHDTQPITAWWDELEPWEREQIARAGGFPLDLPPEEREIALVATLYRSPSRLALLLVSELLGERRRINLPGTIGPHNWTYRLPLVLEDLEADPRSNARFDRLRRLAEETARA